MKRAALLIAPLFLSVVFVAHSMAQSAPDAVELSFRHALAWVQRHGAVVGDASVRIPIEAPRRVRLEQNFVGHYPVEEKRLSTEVRQETSFTFEGIGFAVKGEARSTDDQDYVLEAELYIDTQLVETFPLPTRVNDRRFIPVWKYQLPSGLHEVRLVINNSTEGAYLWLDYAIIYADTPR